MYNVQGCGIIQVDVKLYTLPEGNTKMYENRRKKIYIVNAKTKLLKRQKIIEKRIQY